MISASMAFMGNGRPSTQSSGGVGREGDQLPDTLVNFAITLNAPFKVQFMHVFATQVTRHFLPCN
jgi:hypothetical protein